MRKVRKNLGTRRHIKAEYFPIEKKQVKLPEYHFYEDRKELLKLLEKENDLFYNAQVQREKREIIPDSLTMLEPQEEKEKDRLLATGFTSWTKNDFQAFIRGCEKFGRNNFKKISQFVGSKNLQETENYSEAFWKRIDDLEEKERVIETIEKGEKAIQQKKDHNKLIKEKCKGMNFYDQVTFIPEVYSKFKSRLFTSSHDKYLVFKNAEHGYGNWTPIRAEIKKESTFEFDHYLKSRSEGDMNKRMNSLLKVLKAEINFLVRYFLFLEKKRTK